jgi:AraC-like DNA-binding protein
MATSVTPFRRPIHQPLPDGPLDRVRDLVLGLATENGHVSILDPDLCIYRLAAPTTINKAATFGVTLSVILQGTKHLRIGDHEIVVHPQSLLVITRETGHTSIAVSASPDHPFASLNFCFSPERVAHALLAVTEAGALETSAVETMPAFVLPCDEPIAAALERLLRTLDDPLDRKLLAPLVQEEILFRLLRSDAAAAVRKGVAHAPDAGRILESMQFIRDHHTEKLSVEGLAKQSAMSPSHFAHRFSAVARIAPMRYLREVRLERARALLLAAGARAGDVAVHVGFESPAHFAREFKRRYGLSPSRYRRIG